jgi:2-polyprenyl-3-methyl-5-hydroxy-6-metoxy-1,4-benzoquinol methylase
MKLSELLNNVYSWLSFDHDKINGVYDGTVQRNEKTRQTVRDRIDAMVAQASGRVLDIGCSGGIASILAARKGCEVVGIDCVQESLDKAMALRNNEPKAVQDRVHFEFAYAEWVCSVDNLWDTVMLGQVLEHVISPRVVLDEATRVLKPGGKLLCSVPVGYNNTTTHLRFFELGNFTLLLSEFCEVKSIQVLGNQMLAICNGKID